VRLVSVLFVFGRIHDVALAIEAPQHPRFLPRQLQRFIKFRALELLGFAMLGAAAVMAIALLSYDALDPSAAMASGQTPTNWLGGAGAAASDTALRLIGLAVSVPVLAAACWGLRFRIHRTPSFLWLRIALLPLAAILAAAALSAVPPLASWPLAEGLGGALGASAQNNVWQLLIQIEPTIGGTGAAAVAGLAAFALIIWCAAPPLGPIWRAIRWFWAALRWVYGLGAGGARQVSASRCVVTTDDFDVDEYDEISVSEPAPHIVEPEAPARSRKALSDRIGGALTGRRSRDAQPNPRKKTKPKAPKQRKAPEAPVKPKARRAKSGKQPDLPLDDGFQLPPLDLLQEADAEAERESEAVLDEKARSLEGVLDDFGVKGEIKHSRQGPVVTLYELEPAPGVKASRVIGLADDLARNMMAISVRVATVPGKNVIGVELPNSIRETVYLRELLASKEYKAAGALPLVLGKDISGAPIIVDLARMPHLLIAGTTGSGKSVAINAMILSLLYAMTPEQCRFIMIDPKMLELSVYDGVPHLLAPVVTEPKKAVVALKWVVREMENRYRAMSTLGVRNIAGYNVKIDEARNKGESLTRRVQTGFDPDTGRPIYEEQALDMRALPFIVVVVDEMADLMLVAGKDIEATIQRLAQMARAAGIHIIMATQRPSVDVITGTIKANFPTRMSFQVTSKIDSRTILGEGGAEQLLGRGDGLYMAGGGRIKRVHGPFVEDEEVSDIVAFLKGQAPPEYIHSVTEDESAADGIPGFDPAGGSGSGDDDDAGLYDQAVAIVAKDKKASTSYLQRRLKIGYNRAASLIERMEQEGVVSPANHVGKREILVGDHGADD
jgi:S-DNA-T family DNA segregation ATPase FtsK/SpoIIIE